MLVHDDLTLEFDHEPIVPLENFRLRLTVVDVIGIDGVGHIIGGLGETVLACQMMLDGFETESALMVYLGTLMNKAGELTGDLEETLFDGGPTTTFPECTFLGARPRAAAHYDASDVNGWFMPVALAWVQRVPSSE
jgi:hypothetical protein